jgi:adenosylcobinamide-GDP ribazoletransferase
MKSFILTLQFLTRIPINTEVEIKEDTFAKGIAYFPIIGFIIGLINVGVYFGFSKLFDGTLPLILVTLVNILVTGALHLDGLADTCDGIFSARTKEKMLEIMKDSRLGTNGAVAILFDLALRIGIMNYLGNAYVIKVIIVTPIISRMMLSILIYISSKNGKGNGLGSLFVGKATVKSTLISIVVGGTLSFLILGYTSLIILGVSILFIFCYRNYIISKLGVITGDILGGANELSEILTMLIFVIIQRQLHL